MSEKAFDEFVRGVSLQSRSELWRALNRSQLTVRDGPSYHETQMRWYVTVRNHKGTQYEYWGATEEEVLARALCSCIRAQLRGRWEALCLIRSILSPLGFTTSGQEENVLSLSPTAGH